MRIAGLMLVCGLLGGCDREAERWVPALSDEVIQKMKAQDPGLTDACLEKMRWGGFEAMPEELDQCFRLTEPRRWKGVLHYDLEESRFCADAVEQCPPPANREGLTWLSFSSKVKLPEMLLTRPSDPLRRDFEIEFIGRRTLYPGHYGHMGTWPNEIMVDRLISVREVADTKEE